MKREQEEGDGGGGEGRGVEQRQQREDSLAKQSEGEDELSQTKRSVLGWCVGVVLRVQSKLPHALHAHRGNNLLQNLQPLDNTTMNDSYGKVHGSAGEGRHGICGGKLQTGAWDRMTRRDLLVGCVMAGDCQDGMELFSPTIECSTRHWLDPFARAKSILSLETHGPSERELVDKAAD